MRAVIQRVSEASVTIEGNKVANIASGLLVLLGVMDPIPRRYSVAEQQTDQSPYF